MVIGDAPCAHICVRGPVRNGRRAWPLNRIVRHHEPMPVTPFHMGPGLAVKSVAGNHFSVLMFGVAQVAIDIEPGIGMLSGSSTLHGWTHTYLGATVIAAGVLLLARPLCVVILKWWNRELATQRVGWIASPEKIGWPAAAAGAFIGTYSHVALDSLMHLDIRPFAPFSDDNGLLGLVSYSALHVGCAVAGVAGVAVWLVRQRYNW